MPEPEKQEKMEFPKYFKGCPHCGSTRCLSQAAVLGEYQGPMVKGKPTAMMTMVFANPGPLTTVVVSAQVDICYDCGRVYSLKQNKEKMDNQVFRNLMGKYGPTI